MLINKKLIITGDQVSEKWGVDPINLSYIVLKHNLTVLNPSISKILKLERDQLETESILEIIQQNPDYGLSRKFFLRTEIEGLNLDPSFLQTCFKVKSSRPKNALESGIRYSKKIIKGHPLQATTEESNKPNVSEVEKKTSKDILRDVIEAQEEAIKQNLNVFSLIGKVWLVKFRQREWGLYPDHQKYRYVASLVALSKDDEEDTEFSIDNRDLISIIKKNTPEKADLKDEYLEEFNELNEINIKSDGNKISVDNNLITIGNELASKVRAAELSDNSAFIKGAEEEFNKFKKYMSKEYGILCGISKKGEFRYKPLKRACKEFEKLRWLIKGHFQNAFKDFKESMPNLYKHLRNSLKIGQYETCYKPEQPISWYVST